MTTNQFVDEEENRLEALQRCNVLDTPVEESFDRITRLATKLFEVPIALVSLIDRDRQWFKSVQGLDVRETPREISFCTHAIRDVSAFIVEDALKDGRFAKNPLVLGDPHIRFYAGIPLQMHNGHNLGTLCVIDRKPRRFKPEQVELLADLAGIVVDELNLRQMALTDSLTGAMNRRAFESEMAREVARHQRYGGHLSLIMLDLDRFKRINDVHGHSAGDEVLQIVSERILGTLRPTDIFCRSGGEEFIIVLPETGLQGAIETANRLRLLVASSQFSFGDIPCTVTASFGVTEFDRQDQHLDQVLIRADKALYQAKESGRDSVEAVPYIENVQQNKLNKVA